MGTKRAVQRNRTKHERVTTNQVVAAVQNCNQRILMNQQQIKQLATMVKDITDALQNHIIPLVNRASDKLGLEDEFKTEGGIIVPDGVKLDTVLPKKKEAKPKSKSQAKRIKIQKADK